MVNCPMMKGRIFIITVWFWIFALLPRYMCVFLWTFRVKIFTGYVSLYSHYHDNKTFSRSAWHTKKTDWPAASSCVHVSMVTCRVWLHGTDPAYHVNQRPDNVLIPLRTGTPHYSAPRSLALCSHVTCAQLPHWLPPPVDHAIRLI